MKMNEAEENQRFTQAEIDKIYARYESYSKNGMMSCEQFKKSMGLLGIGQAEILSQRIFRLITEREQVVDNIHSVLSISSYAFCSRLTTGQNNKKQDSVSTSLIGQTKIIISEVSFIWNFLTDEKVSNTTSVQLICGKLGITQHKSITFIDYLQCYDLYFSWFDYFNNRVKPSHTVHHKPTGQYNKQFPIDQIEEYLKLLHGQLGKLMGEWNQTVRDQWEELDQPSTSTLDLSAMRGNRNIASVRQFKLKGDTPFHNYRDSAMCVTEGELSREIQDIGSSTVEIIANRLSQLSAIGDRLFPATDSVQSARATARRKVKTSLLQDQRKKLVLNVTEPSKRRVNIVYFGHQNWNLMLNMMLGIRRSLKSHFYLDQANTIFNEQDLNCKYMNELIYKKNDKSVKEICQIFVDYAPKVFFYIRKYFEIDNQRFLKSIGLENLIGNLLMGNLSTLTDQTSQGKSGSFIYYTQDSRIIVKSISKDEYTKLRQILSNYAVYVKQNPQTFLLHIYGLYKMKNKSSNRQIYFIVINNVFDKQVQIDERYDIKGATHNRETLKSGDEVNKNIALKDVDLIKNYNRVFNIEEGRKKKLFSQICKDVDFLAKHNIIEYSLLVGIHKLGSNRGKQVKIDSCSIINKQGNEMYFFGIIDILSQYSTIRVIQNHFFHIFTENISCVAPEEYSTRFKNFIYQHIFSC